MKKLTLILSLACSFSWAQMNYVALVKDSDGVPASNSNVDIKISIVDYADESSVYYSESHNTSTTTDGIATLIIGEGTVISGNFQTIDWSKKLAIIDAYDLDGNGYTLGGKELIRSVPIAKYAENTSIDSSTFIDDGPGDIIVGSDPIKYSQGAVDLFDIIPGLYGDNILIGKDIFKTKTVSDTSDPTGNIVIGNNAMMNSKSVENIAIGAYSQSESEGGSNIGVGRKTLEVSKGYDNIAIGSKAFDELETGNGNIGIGKEVGFNFYAGANNIAIGYRALGGSYNQANTVTNTTFNTGIGYGSGIDLVGNNNTALGRRSGIGVNGDLNTFLGSFATSADGTDINNSTAIGANSVVTSSNTIQLGDSNINLVSTSGTISASAFVGDGSGLTNISSGFDSKQNLFINQIIGASSQNLTDVSSPNFTIAIGVNSLGNTQVDRNLAVGNLSLASNVSGTINTGVGNLSLYNNTIGDRNTAVGDGASFENVEGNYNVAIGANALVKNINGNRNTAIGDSALYNNLASYNSSLGIMAGHDLNTNDSNFNTFIGAYSDTVSGTSVRNSTAIGANSVVTTSNTIQLGDSNVNLINTSATVSASAFEGNGNSITITESGTILSLLEIIQELRLKIESLEKRVLAAGIYLSENGITVKCDQAAVGFKQEVNGKLYRVVDRQTLVDLVADGKRGVEVDFTCLCTSRVKDFSNIFESYTSFNQDISSWDLSNATTTASMFFSAKEFNQDIGAWDMSGVVNMGGMFIDADKFNQDISNWDVSNVTNMIGLFSGSEVFDQDISKWDVSNVTDMTYMFWTGDGSYGTTGFNQNLNSWCVENITEQPEGFADGNSTFAQENHPIWGTCPSSNNQSEDQVVSLDSNKFDVSDFIWQGLNQYYYWQSSVSALSDSQFSNQTSYTNYIKNNLEPYNFFESLLHEDDRFSWISEDYTELQNQLSGVSAANGVEFQLSYIRSGSDDLVGIVTHILPDSDAATKNISRGDIFTGVNGQTLTVGNYRSLLYSDDLTYTLNLADYVSGNFVLNGTDVELTKVVDFQKNPIQTHKVLNVGDKRIGYLMYNQFLTAFETQLNDVFGTFQSSGLDAFVLDLRYNPGGSVANCARLASMITGQFDGEVFAKQLWNSKLMDYWNSTDPEAIINRFVTTLGNGIALNSLELTTIYVLTSDRTASSSELLINGLSSYIDVIQIGEQTTGKNVASITIYDYIDNEGTKNPDHTYAMQPIVLKIANSDGYADYAQGLAPDTAVNESLTNLGRLGDTNEPLLNAAIALINGEQVNQSRKSVSHQFGKKILLSETVRQQEMYLDLQLDMNFLEDSTKKKQTKPLKLQSNN